MKVVAKLNNLRISPRKVRLMANFIKGQNVFPALDQLGTTVKAGTPQIKKLLESAISNGENNFGLDKNNLYIFSAIVEAGATLKRWMPKAYGRAGAIRKRTCKIIITLEERVEGLGRKSKEEMEKIKKSRLDEIKKQEKEMKAQAENQDKKPAKNTLKNAAGEEKKTVEAETKGKGNWTSKIFRRKSM